MILLSVLSLLTAVTGCSNPYQETENQEVISEKYNSHSINVISLSAAAETSESAYTIQDIRNLQNFLLARPTEENLTGKPYDLDNDNIWTVFDLCLMKREILKMLSVRICLLCI